MPASKLCVMLKFGLHGLSYHPVSRTVTLLHLAQSSPILHIWLAHQLLVPCLVLSLFDVDSRATATKHLCFAVGK